MKKNKYFKKFTIVAYAYFFLSAFFPKISFAAPGIKIVEPENGTEFHSGEELDVVVEPVEDFVLKEVLIVTPFKVETILSTPFSAKFSIPNDAIGSISILASGKNLKDQFVEDELTINVQPNATLEFLKANPPKLYLRERDQMQISVKGVYSDGVERDISDEGLGTTYKSDDLSIVTVDTNGLVKIQGVGDATITILNSGLSVNVPVNVEKGLSVEDAPLLGDLDSDGDVDQSDLNVVLAARNTKASGPNDPRDLDFDGRITALDARKLTSLCTRVRCATQ